jgi:RNA recognition motif-containing protein
MEIQSISACTSIESSPRIPPEQNEEHAIDESRTLFLGDLPSSATVEQISALFLDLQVSHVEIKIINSTKGTLCYSFVSFANADFCQRAFDKYDGNQAIFPDGSIVRVGWAKRNSRLHVSNLDENTTEKDLVDLFTKYVNSFNFLCFHAATIIFDQLLSSSTYQHTNPDLL